MRFSKIFSFLDTTVWSLEGIYPVSVVHDKSKCKYNASILVDGILSGGRGRSASTFWIIFNLKMMRCRKISHLWTTMARQWNAQFSPQTRFNAVNNSNVLDDGPAPL